MSIRSTEGSIRFSQPFRLSQFSKTQPGGSYRLITEEEQVEGPSPEVFWRVRTLLCLPANALPGCAREAFDVDPVELAAALIVDALQGLVGHRLEVPT